MARKLQEKKQAATEGAAPKAEGTPPVLSDATDKTVIVAATPDPTEGIETVEVGDPPPKEAPKEEPEPELLNHRIQTMLGKRPAPPNEAGPTISLPADIQAKVDELMGEGKMSEAMTLATSETAKQVIHSVRTTTAQETTQRDWQKGRDDAAAEVYRRHPDLLEYDESLAAGKPITPTPLLLELQRVYREYPSILRDAKGPLLALETAEETLKKKAAMKAAPTERTMQRTATATVSTAIGGGAAPAPVVANLPKLNDEEKFIAYTLGISDEDYAKTKAPSQKGRNGGHVVHTAGYYKSRQVPMNRRRIV